MPSEFEHLQDGFDLEDEAFNSQFEAARDTWLPGARVQTATPCQEAEPGYESGLLRTKKRPTLVWNAR